MAKPLTDKQRRFVAEYLVDLNGTRAAIRAGYAKGSADVQAVRLLGNARVQEAVAEGQKKKAARLEVSADDVLRELLRIGLADIGEAFDQQGRLRPLHEIPVEVRRAMSGVETEEAFDGSGSDRVQSGWVRKVKFWDKPKALELLGKHLALFTEKHDVELAGKGGGPIPVAAEVKEAAPDAGRIAGILGLLGRVGALPLAGAAAPTGAAHDAEADPMGATPANGSTGGVPSP